MSVGKQGDGGASPPTPGGRPGTAPSTAKVAEALGVAIALSGGPGTVYGARAFAAFQDVTGTRTEAEGAPDHHHG